MKKTLRVLLVFALVFSWSLLFTCDGVPLGAQQSGSVDGKLPDFG